MLAGSDRAQRTHGLRKTRGSAGLRLRWWWRKRAKTRLDELASALCGVFVSADGSSRGPLGGKSARNLSLGRRLGGHDVVRGLRSRIQDMLRNYGT